MALSPSWVRNTSARIFLPRTDFLILTAQKAAAFAAAFFRALNRLAVHFQIHALAGLVQFAPKLGAEIRVVEQLHHRRGVAAALLGPQLLDQLFQRLCRRVAPPDCCRWPRPESRPRSGRPQWASCSSGRAADLSGSLPGRHNTYDGRVPPAPGRLCGRSYTAAHSQTPRATARRQIPHPAGGGSCCPHTWSPCSCQCRGTRRIHRPSHRVPPRAAAPLPRYRTPWCPPWPQASSTAAAGQKSGSGWPPSKSGHRSACGPPACTPACFCGRAAPRLPASPPVPAPRCWPHGDTGSQADRSGSSRSC